MNPKFEQFNESVEIRESKSPDYIELKDEALMYAIFESTSETLIDWKNYLIDSFYEQFGIDVDVEFFKIGNGVGTAIKAGKLPEGVSLEDLRLFSIIKDNDIHDGHYYVFYDTKNNPSLDSIYEEAIWESAGELDCEYDATDPFTGNSARKNRINGQKALRHHLSPRNKKGGRHGWEIEIPQRDRKKTRTSLEIYQNPDDSNSAENLCRELVRKTGEYVIEQLKIRGAQK